MENKFEKHAFEIGRCVSFRTSIENSAEVLKYVFPTCN